MSRRTLIRLSISLVAVSIVLGCDQRSPGTQDAKHQASHPHTHAMLKMVHAMERSGYHPSRTQGSYKTFAENPAAWIGPQHIATPDKSRFQTEWRLTIYCRERDRQPHSFLSVETDSRFHEGLVSQLQNEWYRMARLGLPSETVESGKKLIHETCDQLLQDQHDHPSNRNSLKARVESGGYSLRVELIDSEGFIDSDDLVLDFSRAILFFTRLD